LKINIIINFY